MPNRMLRKSKGFTIIELIIVTAVLSVIALGATRLAIEEVNTRYAKQLGKEIGVFVNAVAANVFANGATFPVVPVVNNGFNWLQGVSCGGPLPDNQALISCGFTGRWIGKFSGQLITTIVRDPVTGIGSATISLGPNPLVLDGKERSDLTGLAVSVAESEYGGAALGNSNGTLDLFIDYDPLQVLAITGLVSIQIQNTAAGADPWLQTAGGNQMLADLNMGDVAGGVGANDIVNADNIFWTGEATANAIANNRQSALINDAGAGSIQLVGTGATDAGILFYRDDTQIVPDIAISNTNGSLDISIDAGSLDIAADFVSLTGVDAQMQADDFVIPGAARGLSQAVTDIYTVGHGSLVPKPANCRPGTTPSLYLGLSSFTGIDQADFGSSSTLKAVAAMQPLPVDLGASWRIDIAGLVQDTGPITPARELTKYIAITKCN